MSDRASVLIGRQVLDGVLVDELQGIGARRDAGDQVAGQVRQAERREQLAQERAREEQEADGGDGPEAALRLGHDARDVEDERAEARQEEEVRQVHPDAVSAGDR